MFYICRINPRATKSVSTHEGAFSSSLNLPRDLGILLLKMMYAHEIVRTYGGTLLPEHASAPVACSGSKTPRVYRPLVKGDINFY